MHIGQRRHDLLDLAFFFLERLSPRVGVMGVVEVKAERAEGWGSVWLWHDMESCSDGLQYLGFPLRDGECWHITCFY